MKKINKVRIIERLRDRFDLEDLTPEAFALIEKLFLFTDVDALLKETKGVSGAVTTTGDGNHYIHTVPDGKRWTWHAYNAYVNTSANADIDRIIVYDLDAGVAVPFIEFTDADYYRELLAHPLVLEEGHQIGVRVQNRTGATDVTMDIWIEEEDAF